MANIYVRSTDGSDADNGSTWALAKATLAGAFAIAAAGDTIYVSQVHAETQASAMTLTSPGTAANPVKVICGNDGAEPPTATATTATISTTGANTLTLSTGWAYIYGVTFNGRSSGAGTGVSIGSTSAYGWILDNCILKSTSSTGSFNIGPSQIHTNAGSFVKLINSSFYFSGTGVSAAVGSQVDFFGGAILASGSSVPTTLFGTGAITGTITLYGVDLSACSGSLVNVSNNGPRLVTLRNCRLHASATIVTGTNTNQGGTTVVVLNCNSGAVNYRNEKYDYSGTVTTETTIVKTGGQSDGTTTVSRKMTSTANVTGDTPMYSEWVEFWNETTGSGVTVESSIITDGVTLTDAEAWIEIEYLGNSSYPLASLANDRVALLGSAANQTTDSATWTTTGLSSPTKQKLGTSVTPQMKGPIRARVALAKASTTMYADLKVLSNSARQWRAGGEFVNEGASGSSGGGYLTAGISQTGMGAF